MSDITILSGFIVPITYVTPENKLNGRENGIFKERDRKLEEARRQRQLKRH